MTPVVLIFLAVLWIVYLACCAVARGRSRTGNSISSFHKQLLILERTSPARPGIDRMARPAGRPVPIFPAASYVPPRPMMSLSQARQRRRVVLTTLAGVAVVSFVLAPFVGSLMSTVQVLADVLLIGYLLLLVRARRLADERRAKVRYLPSRDEFDSPEPPYVLQRSAN